MSTTKIYYIWKAMKQRCFNSNNSRYKDYGGRGIKVCSEWLGENGFQNFYTDMGERPIGKSIDRIKNNLDYCKENCKWSTPKEQSSNRRNSVFITYNGKTKTAKQWADEIGISYQTFWIRLKKGWSVERSLTTKT